MKNHYKFELEPLPYTYDALEPFIDAKTMEIHHNRHLQAYVYNLNKALCGYEYLHSWSLEKLICNADRLPADIRQAVKNNGGGVYNHNFYFDGMSCSAKMPNGRLWAAITKTFGSYENFVTEWKKQALGVFGSGYAWLVSNCGRLCIMTTANQETPLTRGQCPIMTIDVWEHAYYLKHYNKRADYIEDWLQVINWEKAEMNFLKTVDRHTF